VRLSLELILLVTFLLWVVHLARYALITQFWGLGCKILLRGAGGTVEVLGAEAGENLALGLVKEARHQELVESAGRSAEGGSA
jgi:hypothetical protein